MEDIIVIGIVALMVFAAGFYIFKAKKSGKKCIGCPHSSTCSSAAKTAGSICCSTNRSK